MKVPHILSNCVLSHRSHLSPISSCLWLRVLRAVGGFSQLGTRPVEWPRGLYEVRVPGFCPEGKSSQDQGRAGCRVNWEGAQQPRPLRAPATRPVSLSAAFKMAPRGRVMMAQKGPEFTWRDPGSPEPCLGFLQPAERNQIDCLVPDTSKNQGGN